MFLFYSPDLCVQQPNYCVFVHSQRNRMATATMAKRGELLRLYRNLLKNSDKFPLRSRRQIVSEEVRAAFRNPRNAQLTLEELDYKIILGWERNAAIAKFAENMYWFHSRDEVTKSMLHHSQERDKVRAEEAYRCNQVGDVQKKTPEVTEFYSTLYNTHPSYYHKVDKSPLQNNQDLWRCRGQYGSDTGGPRQKFYVKRFKPVFPQGW